MTNMQMNVISRIHVSKEKNRRWPMSLLLFEACCFVLRQLVHSPSSLRYIATLDPSFLLPV